MFVVFKNEEGKYSVRPAYIGFIKNNFWRRLLCSLFYPITIVVTIIFNLLCAVLAGLFMFFKAVWVPIKGIRPIWKTEIWNRPRTKNDTGRMH